MSKSMNAYHGPLTMPVCRMNYLSQDVSRRAMLLLFKEQAHPPAMIRHSITMVREAVQFLNPGQIPVVTFDQPLYEIAKQVQWN